MDESYYCSVPRSLWLGCSSVAESLCALRCLQSIPSTRAHNQVLLHPPTPSPSYLLTFRCPFLPVGSTLLSGSSLVHPQTFSA
uniref:Uncharacterized protein n=1 Tax=Stegastes partitus TaxID=144197 RepID=A0A3B5ALB9_9TELE